MVPFYGAVPPLESLMYPPGYNSSTHAFGLLPGEDGQVENGGGSQRLLQLEFADTFAISAGTHQLKFGADARQLTPTSAEAAKSTVLSNYAQLQAGIAGLILKSQAQTVTARMYNYSFLARTSGNSAHA